jgi:hypothetical protein
MNYWLNGLDSIVRVVLLMYEWGFMLHYLSGQLLDNNIHVK